MYSQADRRDFFRGYEEGYNRGIKQQGQATQLPSYGQPLRAQINGNKVRVYEGNKLVSIANATLPHIERTRFIDEQNKLVVKSRGSHGPARLQLFNARNGRQLASIPAYQKPKPQWAKGMGE